MNTSPDPILLDTNVLADISRGHERAAKALLAYRNSGRTIYIAQAAYNELLDQSPNPRFRSHYREMVKDLGIKIAPAGPMSARVDVYADTINHKQVKGKPGAVDAYGNKGAPGDMFIAAQAKALKAQLWTHDKKFRTRAPQLGVRLAPECALGGISGTEDPARGRRLLGLKPIHVTGSGTVQRSVPRGSGPKGGSGGSGRGGAAPGGGGPLGGASAPPSPGGGPRTRAHTGVPDMRVPPVAGPSPRGKAIGGGIELILKGINALMGWANDAQNKEKVAEALKLYQTSIMNRSPTTGALLVIYYLEHVPEGSQKDSAIQVGPTFSHMEVYYAATEDEAKRVWRHTPAIRPGRVGHRPKAQTLWHPPQIEPAIANLRTPFPRRHLATFVDGRQRVQNVEFGGITGFDDMSEADVPGSGILFHVLEPPSQLTFANGRLRHSVDVPIISRTVGEGGVSVDAVDLDPWMGLLVTTAYAVPVFPANNAAQRAFQRTRSTRDKTNSLRFHTHIDAMRWVRPKNIRIV